MPHPEVSAFADVTGMVSGAVPSEYFSLAFLIALPSGRSPFIARE